jgi:AcrR family transcriptional regulator
MDAVKGRMPPRQAKAHATRARIVRQAYELFCELGYRATTMELIAERAGVAVQTVYFAFRTKDELLRAVHEWTVLGDDPTPPQLQDWHVAAMAEPDARSAMPKIVAGIATIQARTAPMVPVFNAVSHDAAGAIYQQSEDMRRRDMAELVEALAKKTPLRKPVTRRRAADLIFVLTGPMSYRSFVIDSGWKPRDWVRWVSGTLCHDLFADPGA